MTEPRFEELINLYLDNEIGRHELGELKHAIRDNVLRRRKFEHACQLHQAARKALIENETGVKEADDVNPVSSGFNVRSPATSRPESFTSGTRKRGHHSGSGMMSVRQKQSVAHRNASVPTLAERQSSTGAASSVDLGKISLESSRSNRGAAMSGAFSFFDSPVGMFIAVIFTLIGITGLYLLLKLVSPNADSQTDNDHSPNGSSVVSPLGPIDQKELLRELQGPRRGTGNPVDALHASLYQSAAGQPLTNDVQVNYSSTQAGADSSVALPSNSGATVTVQVSQPAQPGAMNGGVQVINSSQLQITLPTQPGPTGNQDVLIKMSLPPTIAPPADSGNLEKSGNETVPPVNGQ